jgi:hypothetical protein
MENLKALRDTISNILEKMFFLVEETPPDQFVESYQYLTVIEDTHFETRIYMGRDLAREITLNFLGVAQEPEELDILDCLQEVLNMVNGNFIGQFFPEHPDTLPLPKSVVYRTSPSSEEGHELLFFRGHPLRIAFEARI